MQEEDGPKQRHSNCWEVISQLRQVLSLVDWGPPPQAKTVLPPQLTAAARGLSTADWTAVFAFAFDLDIRSTRQAMEAPLLLHARAPLLTSPDQCLALLRAVDTPALAAFVLCNILPDVCR